MIARTGLFLQSIDLRLGDLAAFAGMLKPNAAGPAAP